MPFNDSVERPSVKKKPAATNPVSNLVKIAVVGVLGFGAILLNGANPSPGHTARDIVSVFAGEETSADCNGTGCIKVRSGATSDGTLFASGAGLIIGQLGQTPLCEITATGALRGCRWEADTIAGASYTAGQGLSLAGSSFSVAQTISGSLLEFQTVSGSAAYGSKSLRSSGSLVWEGTGSGDSLKIQKTLSTSGALAVEGNAAIQGVLTLTTALAVANGGTALTTLPTRTVILTAGGGLPSPLTGSGASGPEIYTSGSLYDSSMYVLEFGNFAKGRYATWTATMPDSYDGGTLTFVFNWKTAATSGDVRWYIQCRALGDNEAISQSWGTAVGVTDTAATTNTVRISSATAAVTCAGTPAGGEVVQFRVYRDGGDGSDTLADTGALISVKGEYTVSSYSD